MYSLAAFFYSPISHLLLNLRGWVRAFLRTLWKTAIAPQVLKFKVSALPAPSRQMGQTVWFWPLSWGPSTGPQWKCSQPFLLCLVDSGRYPTEKRLPCCPSYWLAYCLNGRVINCLVTFPSSKVVIWGPTYCTATLLLGCNCVDSWGLLSVFSLSESLAYCRNGGLSLFSLSLLNVAEKLRSKPNSAHL